MAVHVRDVYQKCVLCQKIVYFVVAIWKRHRTWNSQKPKTINNRVELDRRSTFSQAFAARGRLQGGGAFSMGGGVCARNHFTINSFWYSAHPFTQRQKQNFLFERNRQTSLFSHRMAQQRTRHRSEWTIRAPLPLTVTDVTPVNERKWRTGGCPAASRSGDSASRIDRRSAWVPPPVARDPGSRVPVQWLSCSRQAGNQKLSSFLNKNNRKFATNKL